MTPVIYTLSDPRTGAVRYVGQTGRSLKRRLAEHVQDVKLSRRYSSNWIKSLLEEGVGPVIELVEECSTTEACDEAEVFWIAQFRALGFALTNLTEGGKVTRGVVVTDKMRETTRKTHLGVKRSAETRAKIGDLHRGKKVSEETRRLLSQSRGGRPVVHVGSGQRFETASEAARAFGLLPQCVSQVANGRNRHTGGHVFKYVR